MQAIGRGCRGGRRCEFHSLQPEPARAPVSLALTELRFALRQSAPSQRLRARERREQPSSATAFRYLAPISARIRPRIFSKHQGCQVGQRELSAFYRWVVVGAGACGELDSDDPVLAFDAVVDLAAECLQFRMAFVRVRQPNLTAVAHAMQIKPIARDVQANDPRL